METGRSGGFKSAAINTLTAENAESAENPDSESGLCGQCRSGGGSLRCALCASLWQIGASIWPPMGYNQYWPFPIKANRA
jgi:hypothetical protein